MHDLTMPFQHCSDVDEPSDPANPDLSYHVRPALHKKKKMISKHKSALVLLFLGVPSPELFFFFSFSFLSQLVLRRWSNITPEYEFRCFVKNQRLVAVSQRDANNYYASLHARQSQFLPRISSFLSQHILPKFPSPNCTKKKE